MYFTDRGIEELEARRGDESVSLAWLAEQFRDFVNVYPEFDAAVDRLATWLARLDDEEDLLSPERAVVPRSISPLPRLRPRRRPAPVPPRTFHPVRFRPAVGPAPTAAADPVSGTAADPCRIFRDSCPWPPWGEKIVDRSGRDHDHRDPRSFPPPVVGGANPEMSADAGCAPRVGDE
jgi:hypothetical protein